MKNYYNAMKQLLERQNLNPEEKKKLEEQWESDIEFEKMELEEEKNNKPLENAYYRVFINHLLVAAIEAIGKEYNCENNVDKVYSIDLFFVFYNYDIEMPIRGGIFVPEISEKCLISFQDFWPGSILNSSIYKDFFMRMCKNVSFYTEVLNSTVDSKTKDDDAELYKISFKCTLKELIDMYYMEIQRREYENYDARTVVKSKK